MDAKFTKGPWRVDPDKNGYYDVIPESGNGMAVVGCEGIDNEANARLIAAAPELLEALVKARQELANLPSSYGYQFTHIADMDSAIAKATGGQP